MLLDLETQRMLREVYGAHPATLVNTPRIVDMMNAVRADKRDVAPEGVRIVGVHENAQIKVLLVEVGGSVIRADGAFYNIAMFMPEAGLHIKTIDELAQALLLSVRESKLRNHLSGEMLGVTPAFVVGVERPKAIMAEPRKVAQPSISRFVRVG